MKTRFNFTKQNISNIAGLDNGKRLYIYDERVNGLGLSITPTGAKSFIVYRKIAGKPVRVTLGRFPEMTLEQARKTALDTLHQMADGVNPLDKKREKRATGVTLSEVFNQYLQIRKRLKIGTVTDYQKAMRETFSDWLNKPMQQITKDKVLRRHAERGAKSRARADNAFRVLRALFNFAKDRYEDSQFNSLFPENPVAKLSATRAWFKVPRKQTYLKPSELPTWFAAVNGLQNSTSRSKADIVQDYLLFLLFTGTRREEAASLRWEHVNFEEKTFTLINTKNSEVITLPMSDFVTELLTKRRAVESGDYIFAGGGRKGYLVEPRKQIAKIETVSGITFCLHDLRRTFATIGDSLDISSYTLKRLLNHKINYEADVTAGYVVLNPERLRKASQRITDQILEYSRIR
jgi:integrase